MRSVKNAVTLTLLGVFLAGIGGAARGADAEIRVQPLEIVLPASVTVQEAAFERSATPRRQRLLTQATERGRVRVIVGLVRTERVAATQARLLGRLGPDARVNRRFRAIPYVALSVDRDGLQRLFDMDDVRSVEEDVAWRPLLESTNAVIGTALAWDLGLDGTGQTVAVLDSGIAAEHAYYSATGNKVVSEACYSTTDPAEHATSLCPGGVAESTAAGSGADCPGEVYACFHGSHVGGIAAGNDGAGPNYGVARGADVVAIKVFSRIDDVAECDPSPSPCMRSYSSDLVRALERVLELSATLDIAAVNLSLGGGLQTSVEACDAEHPATLAIATELRAAGIAVVAASGNSGTRDRLVAPACLSPVVSVASTHDNDGISSFSSVSTFLDLVAPGHRVDSAVPGGGTGRYSGTSMAAPHVAGAWALLRQAYPGVDVDHVLHTLKSTATPVDDQRQNGELTDLPRLDIGLAVTAPVESWFFTVFNDGDTALTVTSIAPETTAPWLAIDPSGLTVEPGGHAFVTVDVDLATAPFDGSRTRLLIASNDPDASPLPDGVFVVTPPLRFCGNGIVEPGEACDSGDGLDCADGDGDTFSFCVDCDDTDPHRWGPEEWNDGFDNQCPGDPGYGQVDESPTTARFDDVEGLLVLSWEPQPGAVEYEIARALDPRFGAGSVCTRLAETRWHAAEIPPTGGTFFYLERAASPWPGAWGLGAGGVERAIDCS